LNTEIAKIAEKKLPGKPVHYPFQTVTSKKSRVKVE